jgi:hypothetical protein
MQIRGPEAMKVVDHIHDLRHENTPTCLVESTGEAIHTRRLVTCGAKNGAFDFLLGEVSIKSEWSHFGTGI